MRKLLTHIAQRVNYRFNRVLTEQAQLSENNPSLYILTADNGLQIRIFNTPSPDHLPLWKLGFIHNNRFSSFAKIGCSLSKSPEAIVEDVSRRLLSKTYDVIKRKEDLQHKENNRAIQEQARQNFIAAVKRQFSLKTPRNERFTGEDFEVLNGNKERVARFTFDINNPKMEPTISLRMSRLNSQQLFQILNIITNK